MTNARERIRFQEEESRFAGRYGRGVFQTLYFAYRPVLKRFAFLFALGLLGRLFILFNANLIGYWVDALGRRTDHLPSWARAWGNTEFLKAMLAATGLGFVLTLGFRIGFARASAEAISTLYDETTYRTSRYSLSFFDATPVGRIITRFSSDYGNVFRMFGGPLTEFINIVFDLIAMIVLITTASPFFLPIVVVLGLSYWLTYRAHRDGMRVARQSTRACVRRP